MEFQDHAVARLFAALSRDHQKPYIEVKLLSCIHKCASGTKLQCILEDFVLRNWRNKSMVSHGDKDAWSVLLKESDSFRKKFLWTMRPWGMPSVKSTALEDYLIRVEV
jgi:hypothetical protein